MPFIGLTPFLHALCEKAEERGIVCQCPLSGLLHFYDLNKMVRERLIKELCQCPSSGLLHFYKDVVKYLFY